MLDIQTDGIHYAPRAGDCLRDRFFIMDIGCNRFDSRIIGSKQFASALGMPRCDTDRHALAPEVADDTATEKACSTKDCHKLKGHGTSRIGKLCHDGDGQSSAVAKFGNALLLGAMVTTKERAIFFESVSDNSDTACRAGWCQRMDGALETVVGMGFAVLCYLEGLIVIVSASLTFCH